MSRMNLFWAIHYAFLCGLSVNADYAGVLGPEYVLWARLYFVGGCALAVVLFSWPLFRSHRRAT